MDCFAALAMTINSLQPLHQRHRLGRHGVAWVIWRAFARPVDE
jgi:hypothetical protein